jgi:hypothetical protein
MEKKIAILYTGEFRTIEKTIELFKQNVLINDNYHVFAVIQDNNNENIEQIVKKTIKNNLKTYINFDKNDNIWINIRENLLNDMNTNEGWKNYLRNSGSMIEYYQMYLAYNSMSKYEKDTNTEYEFVIRFRTDTILKDKLNFDWLQYNDDTIKNILYKIKDKYNLDKIMSIEALNIFFNTFYNEKRIDYTPIPDCDITNSTLNKLLNEKSEEQFVSRICEYIKNGDYIISFRINIIYFIKRRLMEKIHLLGINYGKYVYEKHKDNYWVNAECQFRQICLQNNIDFYSSTTKLEDMSLYEYNKNNYFDETNNFIENNYSFFIMRN